MNTSIEIRDYSPADKEALINLLRLNTPEYFAAAEEADFRHYLDFERELYYTLLLDGEIAGCGGLNFEDGGTTGIISWDIIHPAHQGKVLGARLVQHRLKKLKSIEGVQKVVVRTSQLTHKFYQKQGFRLIEIVKDHWAEGFDMYRMELAQLLIRSS
ncbi:MAG: GNAT family N-acetyltransferase [Cryomorphaceae bacterium]|nr:GNAT family N-acetyltransferase [Flavobacteriales bacterium]